MGRHSLEFKNGLNAETLFRKIGMAQGYDIVKASSHENMYDHIDYHVTVGNKVFSVDVKARKKTSRSDRNFDDTYTWVEFKNVRGDDGWLYGKADKIVFEQSDSFWLVDRKSLLAYCLDRVLKIHVDNSRDAAYRYYTRKGRKDLLSRIVLKDAIESDYFSEPVDIWKKVVDNSYQ